MGSIEQVTENVRSDVKAYYGEVLQSSQDLKTSACCPIDAMPEHIKAYLANIHDEVIARFYGCGSPLPMAVEGITALDLGCGTGRDVYVLSQMIGENGKVIGVDMTDEQLKLARDTQQWHQEKFNHKTLNTEFHKGFIEDLQKLGIKDNSVDLVTSNCVINLSANKTQVFEEILRVLKPGGELYFSDVFADRRLPEELQRDKVLLGECLGGAMYTEDFRRVMNSLGVPDFRITAKTPITLDDPGIIEKAGHINFYSITVRAFKMDLEDRCEDYGQVATYKGGITHSVNRFMLDDHHVFEKDRPMLVCGNTADMLQNSRYGQFFTVTERNQHFGLFDCSEDPTQPNDSNASCC